MKILVACEESQAVTIEMRKLGHEAYSCDIEPCSGGHPVQKKTRLWLKGLPLLKPTEVVDYKCGCHEAGTWFMKGGKERQKNRSKTFQGVAKAMAEQWAGRMEEQNE